MLEWESYTQASVFRKEFISMCQNYKGFILMLNGSEKWEHFKDSYPFPFSIHRFPLSLHRYPIPSFGARALHSCFKGRVI